MSKKRKKNENNWLILPAIFLTAFLFCAGIWSTLDILPLYLTGEKANGTIIELVAGNERGKYNSHARKIEFETIEGEKIIFTEEVYTRDKFTDGGPSIPVFRVTFTIGKTVEVVYDKSDPHDAMVNDGIPTIFFPHFVFITVGGGGVILFSWLFYKDVLKKLPRFAFTLNK